MKEEEKIGYTLKRIRAGMGLSQTEFARIVGSSKQVVSRYENNQRVPKFTTVVEFAEKLGIPLTSLVYGELSPSGGIAEKGPLPDDELTSMIEFAAGLSREDAEAAVGFIRGLRKKD